MKKLLGILFIIFILFAAIYAGFQSPFAKNWIRNRVETSLAGSGFQVQIDSIDGALPQKIILKNLRLQKDDLEIKAETLSVKLILWRLLKRELAFKEVVAKDLQIDHLQPFDFKGSFRMNKNRAYLKGIADQIRFRLRFDFKTFNALLNAQNDLFQMSARAAFSKDFELLTSNVNVTTEKIFEHLPIDATGKLSMNFRITENKAGYQALSRFEAIDLEVKNRPFASFEGNGTIRYENRRFFGKFITEPKSEIEFDLSLLPSNHLDGTIRFQLDNLQTLLVENLYGKLNANLKFSEENEEQSLYVDLDMQDFYYKDLFSGKIDASIDLKSLFEHPAGELYLDLKDLTYKTLELEKAVFQTQIFQENNLFSLQAQKEEGEPIYLQINGSYKDHFQILIDELYGTVFNSGFSLQNPIQITYTENEFYLPDAAFFIGDGTAKIRVQREGKNSFFDLDFKQIPLELLSFNPLNVNFEGVFDLKAHMEEKEDELQGTIDIDLSEQTPIIANGTISVNLKKNELLLKANIQDQDHPLLIANVQLPIGFSLFPFEIDPKGLGKLSGKIQMDLNPQDFLDYFDLKAHHLTGRMKADLTLSNTLSHPFVKGLVTLENGSYENYYTGTELKNIRALLVGKNDQFLLQTFEAEDSTGNGKLSGKGFIKLDFSDLFPFKIKMQISHLKIANIDLVESSATGDIEIEGNLSSGIAKGNILIEKCALTIPDHIPHSLPELDVVYRNPLKPPPNLKPEYKPYPLFLDLDVSAPTDVTISGRGLNSNWKGDLHLGGTFSSIAAKGTLELIDGEFNFSSRTFKLIEGSLSLSGLEHQMPKINLAGVMETKGVLITARLQGPLDDPQLTFQSSPPLPLSSIMSYLLFGQDISEIGGFEALQIATSLASLAGTGPDVMESTRQALGVDRLRVVSSPTEEGGETVAIQVGKYVTKGVLVSFSQGPEESSTNISVEVEIKGNIVFQIESDQKQEQGKFTLKWRRNY